ncbi:MAG: hydrogenase, partial [Deinococcota bacterium]
MATLVWLHGGACNGNTQSFLNAEEPTVVDLVTDFGIEIVYHHSICPEMGDQIKDKLEAILADGGPDIFVFEGTVIQGPNNTGRYDMFLHEPMMNWVKRFADSAQFTVALGDCACWGGVPATSPNPTDSVGLQYLKENQGGFL